MNPPVKEAAEAELVEQRSEEDAVAASGIPAVRGNYPLSALFLLLTACGVVIALASPVGRSLITGQVGGGDTRQATAVGSLLIMLLGGLIGSYHYRRLRGLAWGLLTGAAVGLVLGPVTLTPAAEFPSLMAICLGGAVLLALTGGLLRAVQGSGG